MSEYSKKLHYSKDGTTTDIILYNEAGASVPSPALHYKHGEYDADVQLYDSLADVSGADSLPALYVSDAGQTAYAPLVEVGDSRATELRVKFNDHTYAVAGSTDENELLNVPPDNVPTYAVTSNYQEGRITWTDPDDVVHNTRTLCAWAGTKVVRKAGSAPTSPNDGVLLVDNKTKNAYKTTYLADPNLPTGVTYYYGFYPYGTNGRYASGIVSTLDVSAKPTPDYGYFYEGSNSSKKRGYYVLNGGNPILTLHKNSTGTFSVSSSDTSIVTCSLSGNTLTLTPVGIGTASIQVYISEGTDHAAVTFGIPVTIVNSVDDIPASGYKVMTVKIDQNDSNPATCCTYADDALGMTPGSGNWDEWFGEYPVLFKNGKEIVRINRNNYAQDINGNAIDITSGNAGDVMVAFPRRGLRISTDANNVVTISMTDEPDNPEFKYYAHRRGNTQKDVFYLGAYKGFVDTNNKLRSLSGKTPTASKTIGTFRTHAHNNGTGYEQSGFYQLTFRQAMYVLKYKNLNSQEQVGMGYVGGTSVQPTGATNTRGMQWGSTSSTEQMKLFGIEDFWGNISEWLDGFASNGNYDILTATDNFNDGGTGYGLYSSGASSAIDGYMTKIQGTTEKGFFTKAANGSQSTYYADLGYFRASRIANHGGWCSGTTYIGAFFLALYHGTSTAQGDLAARLMFL